MDRDLIASFIEPYFQCDNLQISPLENGANNLSYKVVGKESYILRIYRNHSNIDTLLYEHEILQTLKIAKLSFKVPAPILTLKNEPYVVQDGIMAALFPFIEGEEANRETIHYRELGEKVAELSVALQNCQPTIPASYPPTFQLMNVHPNVNQQTIIEFFQQTADSDEKQFFQTELTVLLEEIDHLVERLPIQIIHGDLMVSNILLKDGHITGFIDFEFVSPDFRMTEVAIIMSQFIREGMKEEELFTNFLEFVKGYCMLLQPTDEEINALPTLIKIRMATLVFHFLGRYMNQLDTIDIVENQLKRFSHVCKWTNQNSEKMVQLFTEQRKLM